MNGRLAIPIVWDVVVLVGLRFSLRGLKRALITRRFLQQQGEYATLQDVSRQHIRRQANTTAMLLIDLLLGGVGTFIAVFDGHHIAIQVITGLIGPLLTLVAALLAYQSIADDRLRSRTIPTPAENRHAKEVGRRDDSRASEQVRRDEQRTADNFETQEEQKR